MKKIVVNFALLLILFLLFACAKEPIEQQLLKSMARLDRAYIPTLVFANLHRQIETEVAFEIFKKEWKNFNQKYNNLELTYGLDIVDTLWPEDFFAINDLIISTEALIKQKELEPANKVLLKINRRFASLRDRHGYDYVLDDIIAFQQSMENIFAFLRGKAELDQQDLEKFSALADQVDQAWTVVVSSEIQTKAFNFKPAKVAALKRRIDNQAKAITNFKQTLAGWRQNRMFQAAQDIKPEFMVILKAFGDFEPIFRQARKIKTKLAVSSTEAE